ncbi:MAG: type II toxin-antitoxin system RelE family toxin [Candidatus Goldiibacteriota bacterium]
MEKNKKMKYAIEVTRQAGKFLKDGKISENIRRMIYERVLLLGKEPFPPGAVKLKGNSYFRIRQGDYRIIYEVRKKVLIIVIISIAHRKNVYNKI